MTPIKITGLFIIILGLAIGVFLVQNQQIVRAQAWDCQTYVFNVSQDGVVTAHNGSSHDQPAQQARVFINDVLVATFNVPILDPRDGETLGRVDVPASGQFTWRVEGTMDCSNSGSYGISPTPTTIPTSTPTSTPTPTIIPSISPTPLRSIVIVTDVFHGGAVGKGYTGFFVAEARDYNFDPILTITASGLPPGLTASTDRCLVEYIQNPSPLIVQAISCPLDGIPTVDGDYMVLITVTDDFGLSESKSIPLKVIKSAPPDGCVPGFLPGDGNGDCTVDGFDYGIWFINYNQNVVGEAADGDYDLSGFVDGFDYGIWFINFGKSVAPP